MRSWFWPNLVDKEAITPAAVSINLIYPAANPSLLWRWKAIFFYFLTAKQEIKKPFQRQKKVRITRLPGWHEVDMYNCTSVKLITAGWTHLHGCWVNSNYPPDRWMNRWLLVPCRCFTGWDFRFTLRPCVRLFNCPSVRKIWILR